MAANIRGYTQGSKGALGTIVAWPAGTVAGDLALIHCGGTYSPLGPTTPTGWTAKGHKSFYKILTAADLAGQLVVNASHIKTQTFYGARGIGGYSTQNGLTISEAGAVLWVESSNNTANMAPSTYRQGAEFVDENGYYQASYAMPCAVTGRASIPSMASGATSYSYEILPSSGPAAPTLVSPAAGASLSKATAIVLDWDHGSSFPQTTYYVRLTYAGPTYRYLDAAGALQLTEQAVSSAATTATIAANALTAGTAYTWAVSTADQNGRSAWSTERALNPVNPPTVNTVTVTCPAGDLSPQVDATATAGSGQVTAHQTWICAAADTNPTTAPLWTSGVVPSAVLTDVAPSSTAWTKGASLKAWVQVVQTGGVASAPVASAAFSVTWTQPATPTLTTSTSVSPPTVSVAGLTNGATVEVQMRRDGVTWEALTTRTASGATIAGIPAPLAATGASVSFRARQATVTDGVAIQSAWSTIASFTAPAAGGWLVDDADRSVYLAARMLVDGPLEPIQGVTVTYGLGATAPYVDRTEPQGDRGQIAWQCLTQAATNALLAWIDEHPTSWVVRGPEGGLPLPAKRCSWISPPTTARKSQGPWPTRIVTVDYVVLP